MKALSTIAAAAIALLAAAPAKAEGVWVFEFDFEALVNYSPIAAPWCERAEIKIPSGPPNERAGGTFSCGGGKLVYTHFFGRSCFNDRPWLPRLEFECGWRHRSAPREANEIYFDAIGLKTRFTFGRERPRRGR